MRGLLIAVCIAFAGQAHAACPPATGIEPVVSLNFGSRYEKDDASRSVLNRESNAAVTQALQPVDDFIREMSWNANNVLRSSDDRIAHADCLIAELADWAEADALSDLKSFNASLAIGARLAGIAEVFRQLRPFGSNAQNRILIESWLKTRAYEQIDFWEKTATDGARQGNLRAWASLAVFLAADLTDDDYARLWSLASAARVVCSAREDGSLPLEMGRGRFALHYQFYAIAPLTVLAARADDSGVALHEICGKSLQSAVNFALQDFRANGAASMAYSGEPQWMIERPLAKNAHNFAWIPAYLTIVSDSVAAEFMANFEDMVSSKLGGDQRLLWETGQDLD